MHIAYFGTFIIVNLNEQLLRKRILQSHLRKSKNLFFSL